MPNTIAYHLQASTQPIRKQQSALLLDNSQTSIVYILGTRFSGMEYPSIQFGSVLLAVRPPSFLCACVLAVLGKLRRP